MTTGCGCGCDGGETLIFTCAGAAHSGQAANRAGVQAMQQGIGNLFCIAAVAADVPDKMARARKAGNASPSTGAAIIAAARSSKRRA